MAKACNIVNNKIIQTAINKNMSDVAAIIDFLDDFYMASNGTEESDLLKDYTGTEEEKIDKFLNDFNKDPRISAVSRYMDRFKNVINSIDSFDRVSKSVYDAKKTLKDNFISLLDRYYTSYIKMNPVSELMNFDSVDSFDYTDGQKEAIKKINDWAESIIDGSRTSDKSDYFTLIGKAGTGKTTVAKEVLFNLMKKFYAKNGRLPNIQCSALSHKAKDVLRQSLSPLERVYNAAKTGDINDSYINFNVLLSTAQGIINTDYKVDEETGDIIKVTETQFNSKNQIPQDIIIVDECSMADPSMIKSIINSKKEDAILIFMGDSGQAIPVYAEGQLNTLAEDYGDLQGMLDIPEEDRRNFNPEESISLSFYVKNPENTATLTERVRSGEGHPLLEYADKFWSGNKASANDEVYVDSNDYIIPKTKITDDGALLATSDEIQAFESAVEVFKEAIQSGDPNKIQYCCYRKTSNQNDFQNHNYAIDNVEGYNMAMHERMVQELGVEENKYVPFFVGEPVYLNTANISQNNARGVIISISDLLDADNTEYFQKYNKNGEPIQDPRNNDVVVHKFGFKYVNIKFKGADGTIYEANYVPDIDNGKNIDNYIAAWKNRKGNWKTSIGGGAFFTDIYDKTNGTDRYKVEQFGLNAINRGEAFMPALFHGYASTIHKSQGSTFETVIVDYDDLYNSKNRLKDNFPKLVYTGLTRAKNTCVVINKRSNKDMFQGTNFNSIKQVVEHVKSKKNESNTSSKLSDTDKKSLKDAKLLYGSKEDKEWAKSIDDFYNRLVEKGIDSIGIVTKPMIEKMIKLAKQLNESGVVMFAEETMRSKYSAYYNTATGNIVIDKYHNFPTTTIHELLHAISHYALSPLLINGTEKAKVDKELVNAAAKIKAAYEVFAKEWKENKHSYDMSDADKFKLDYAASDVNEFLAQMADPVVVSFVQQMDKEKGKGLIESIKDFINKVLSYIKSIFHNNYSSLNEIIKDKTGKDYNGLFDMVSDALNDILDHPSKELKDFSQAQSLLYEENINKFRRFEKQPLTEPDFRYFDIMPKEAKDLIFNYKVVNSENKDSYQTVYIPIPPARLGLDIDKLKGTLIQNEGTAYIIEDVIEKEGTRHKGKDVAFIKAKKVPNDILSNKNIIIERAYTDKYGQDFNKFVRLEDIDIKELITKNAIESKNTESYPVEIYKGYWTRDEVAKQTDKVFLFGDNTEDRTVTHYVPSTTQAVIRGLSNAIGIDTKKDRGTSESSYFTDADFDTFKAQVDEAIQKAKNSGKTIVIPADGIGTGKAMLKEKAPKCFEYLQSELQKLHNTKQNTVQGNSEQPSSLPKVLGKFTIHSGGANGADSYFAELAQKTGASYKGYYIPLGNSKPPMGNTEVKVVNTVEELEKLPDGTSGVLYGDMINALTRAADNLGRNLNNMVENAKNGDRKAIYALNLIRRDYVQMVKSDRIIAVGRLTNQFTVDGGTGYAVQMAIDSNAFEGTNKEIYVFNTADNEWYKCSNDSSYGYYFFKSGIPTLTENTAGIGDTELTDEGKKAIEDVFKKTLLTNTDKSTWDSFTNQNEREQLFANKDFDEVESNNLSKQTDDVVTLSYNANNIKEFNIRKPYNQKRRQLGIESMPTNGTFEYPINNEMYGIFVDNNISAGDILRIQYGNNIISMRISDVHIIDNSSIKIEYENKQVVSFSSKMDITKPSKTEMITDISECSKNVEIKKSIKQEIGSSVYSSRVTYLKRRFTTYINNLKKALVKSGTIDNDASVSEVLNQYKLAEIKQAFSDSIKVIEKKEGESDEDFNKRKEDHIINSARKYIASGNFSEDEFNEALEYSRSIFDSKNNVNKLIKDNFDLFFNDAIMEFGKEYDLDIDIFTETIEKKDEDSKEKEDTNNTDETDESNIKDKEYETVEKWQVGETHALSSASTRLKVWLSRIPLRDKDGKITLDDIGEPMFVSSNRIYNELQPLMNDCFTFDELNDKLERMGESDTIYKSVHTLLNKPNNYWVKTELFQLLNNEEINYEEWYTDYTNNGTIKKYNVRFENIDNGGKDTYNLVYKNISSGINLVGTSVFRLNNPVVADISRQKILDDLLSKIKGLTLIEDGSSFDKYGFSESLKDGVVDLNAYYNKINNDVAFNNDIKNLHLVLRSIGFDITLDDLKKNLKDTSNSPYPIVDIARAAYSLINEFSNFFANNNKNNFRDYINMTKDGKKLLSALTSVCPILSSLSDKSSVTYINGNNYPKYKPLSYWGNIIKHLKDPDEARRNKWIEENFKKYSWFYTNGNLGSIKTKIENALNGASQQDSAVLNKILSGLNNIISSGNNMSEQKRNNIINRINEEYSNLSISTKSSLTNKDNPAELLVNPSNWRNKTLAKLMDGLKYSNKVKRHRVVSFNKNGYFKWDKQDFVLMALEKYGQYRNSENSDFADFLMPIYSDAGVMEFVTLPKMGSMEACMDSLIESFNQEKSRIKLIKERKQYRLMSVKAFNDIVNNTRNSSLSGRDREIYNECYDDLVSKFNSESHVQPTDCSFYSLPIQNLEDIETLKKNDDGTFVLETKKGKEGQGNFFNFFSFIYNYKGFDITEDDVTEDDIRKAILGEIQKEANYLQSIIDANKYGQYNYDTKKFEAMYRKDGEEIDNSKLIEFCLENMCANIAITELTVTDLAQYKDAIDFQKRYKEIYAGTKRLNTTFDEVSNKYARENYTQIVLKDIFRPCNGADFKNIVNNSDIPDDQKKWLIETYGKVNLTDAQSYRSLSSIRAVMSMSGEWNDKYDKIFNKLENGEKLSLDELKTFFQPRKPFVFTHLSVDAKNGKNDISTNSSTDNMKIGFQIKNSEFLLMYLYSQTDTLKSNNSAVIRGLNKFMEDNCVDCIHFNSGIKVGGQGIIDLDHSDLQPKLTALRRDFETDEEFIEECRKQLKNSGISSYDNSILDSMKDSDIQLEYRICFRKDQDRIQENTEKMLYYLTKIPKSTVNERYEDKFNRVNEFANKEFVKIMPYSEYGIISSTPEHWLDKKQKLGTQLMRLLTSDNLGKYNINGQEMDGEQVFHYVSKLLTAKAITHHDNIEELFSDDNKLLQFLLKQMSGNSKYSPATISAVQSTNEQGKLNLLGDSVIKTQVESLINSFIRSEINDVEVEGGTCIQVTAAFSDELKIKYTNDEKGNRIKYWECRLPIALKEVYALATDKNGLISVEKLMNNPLIDDLTKEKLLNFIGCRVPTESKHSIQHLRCVGFLPSNAGSCIMLPYEITKTSGADFDIDKLYIWRYSFKMEKVEITENGKNKTIKVPRFIDYKDTPIVKMSEKQLNNAIIDAFWEVLSNKSSAIQELIPNSYDNTQKAAYVGTLYHNPRYDDKIKNEFNKKNPDKDYNDRAKYDFLMDTDIDELQHWYTIGLNRCSLMNQSYFFDLNSKGKGMLGIMAVNNVFLSLLQHTNVGIKPEYQTVINGLKPDNLSRKTVNRVGRNGKLEKVLASTTLSEFLAAAPDSAKDPTLVFLGINNQNVNALVAAALLNYNIEDISLFFNHPAMKRLFEGVSSQTVLNENDIAMRIIKMFTPQNDDGSFDYTNQNEYLKEVIEYAETGKTDKNGNPIREVVIKEASNNYNVSFNDLLNSENGDSDIRIMVAFYKLFCIGKDLNNLAQVIREDSTAGSNSSTMAGNTSKVQKIQRVMKENKKGITSLTNAGDLIDATNISDDLYMKDEKTREDVINNIGDSPLGYIQAQLTFALMNTFKFCKGKMPDFSPFVLEASKLLATLTPNGYCSEKIIRQLCYDFIKYKLSQIPFFGAQTRNGKRISLQQKMAVIVNEMWDDINNIKVEYNINDNKLLNTLTVNNKGVVIIEDAGQLTEPEKKELTDSWEDLINSPYDKVRMLGYNLIRYSFYRNTLKFAPDGFGHLCPDVRSSIPGYVEAIESSYTENVTDTNVEAFLTQFINNNAKDLPVTKRKNLRDDQYGYISESKKVKNKLEDEDDYQEEDELSLNDNEELSYGQSNSDDIEKKYNYVIKGEEGEPDKYYSLNPSQIVPRTNLKAFKKRDENGNMQEYVEILDSKTSDFTYYTADVDSQSIFNFVLDNDLMQRNRYDISSSILASQDMNVANAKSLKSNANNNDVFDVLQEMKDNNELTYENKTWC